MLFAFLGSLVRSRVPLQMEIVALRHQLAIYKRSIRRPQIRPPDRVLWAWLSRQLVPVAGGPGLGASRDGHRLAAQTLSSPLGPPGPERTWPTNGQPGTPDPDPRHLGAESALGLARILGELRKLGIAVAQSTIEKYRLRPSRPASPSWRAFLQNHLADVVALDFFTVPTVGFKVLFVLIVLAHDRRRVRHFNVTEHPTAQWAAQQLVEAFPWETAPKYLLRDRDGVYGQTFQQRTAGLGMVQVLRAPRRPWQNPYAERVIGSIRRECLDHVIVFSEDHLRRLLARYVDYYHRWRTHLALAMDAPDRRPVQSPEQGAVVAVPEVGGLYYHYERRAA